MYTSRSLFMPFNVTRLTILAGCFRGFAYCSGRRLVYTEEGWRCRTGPFKAVDSWDYMNYPERLVQMFLILRRTAGMIVAVLRKAWKTDWCDFFCFMMFRVTAMTFPFERLLSSFFHFFSSVVWWPNSCHSTEVQVLVPSPTDKKKEMSARYYL